MKRLYSESETAAAMRKLRRGSSLTAVAILFLIGLTAGGCAKSSDLRHVHGVIKYRNEPVSNASITFFPSTGRAVTAAVPEGEYNVELAPGDFTVTISVGVQLPKGFKEGDPIPAPKYVLSDEYTSRTKSKLKANVGQNQSDPINFDLK